MAEIIGHFCTAIERTETHTTMWCELVGKTLACSLLLISHLKVTNVVAFLEHNELKGWRLGSRVEQGGLNG